MLASRSSTTRKPSLDVEIPILNATSAGTTTGAGAGAGGAGSGDDDALCRICSGEGACTLPANRLVCSTRCLTPLLTMALGPGAQLIPATRL